MTYEEAVQTIPLGKYRHLRENEYVVLDRVSNFSRISSFCKWERFNIILVLQYHWT